MDFEPEPEHIVCYYEKIIAHDLKIYSRYKNKTYISHCVKYIMISGSIVIKNALDAENSDCFYVPPDIEIEPNAFKKILAYLHIKTLYPDYEIEMKDQKNIQNMLLICNWFGFTQLYDYLIMHYILQLRNSDRTLDMFTNIDNIRNFLDIKQDNKIPNNNIKDNNISCDIPRRNSSNAPNKILYNPIFGLITGDKLNDSKLIDISLSLFDFKTSICGVIEPYENICVLLNEHLMRDTTKEILYLILNHKRRIYEQSTVKMSVSDNDFSRNYVTHIKINWDIVCSNPKKLTP
jgi:hypothetical protein